VQAGLLLGDLGDPRFPSKVPEWQRAIELAQAGQTGGYFCQLPSEQPQTRIWIARLPIANAQMQEWERLAQIAPRRHALSPNFNRPNQPASSVAWHTATAFCAWLSLQTQASIRLPSDAEWDLAAYAPGRRYPWGNQRDRDRAALKHDQAARRWPYPVPVGCYPAGASAAGVLDLVGNVWEWTTDVWERQVGGLAQPDASAPRVLRGGGYHSTKQQALEITRIGLAPESCYDNGFRVVLEQAVE
jgi:formylglycine-generating enzyme required for sulfatase activity